METLELFIFSFSLVEQGMAGATLTNIPEEKTDGWTNSSNTRGGCLGYRCELGLGFLFRRDTFFSKASTHRIALHLFNNAVSRIPTAANFHNYYALKWIISFSLETDLRINVLQ